MPAINSISVDKLARLVGTPGCPAIIDVASSGEGLIPGSVRRSAETVADWAPELGCPSAIVACAKGESRSQGVAAWLRNAGIRADVLDGGRTAWAAAGQPLVREAMLPARNAAGATVWVTRSRPKVDRIACPWLIRRFVDPAAIFLFVAPAEVAAVAERYGAAPFDVEDVFWSHRGELCTFDVMVEELGKSAIAALERLAVIIRGADTARPDLAPQAAGLLAVSLGLSRMHSDDLEQLAAGMAVYDALYRWCRDAVDETHDWVSHAPKRRKQP
ncbi:MAG TPA: sulfurtransferase/chromate resistance protein [Sphingomicrobium sp.]|nr:sulfurtransferase/chromate resistance protein [Sphingomicrobium sp.]